MTGQSLKPGIYLQRRATPVSVNFGYVPQAVMAG